MSMYPTNVTADVTPLHLLHLYPTYVANVTGKKLAVSQSFASKPCSPPVQFNSRRSLSSRKTILRSTIAILFAITMNDTNLSSADRSSESSRCPSSSPGLSCALVSSRLGKSYLGCCCLFCRDRCFHSVGYFSRLFGCGGCCRHGGRGDNQLLTQ